MPSSSDPVDALLGVADEVAGDDDRRRQQGHARRQAVLARQRAEQDLASRALQRPDRRQRRRRLTLVTPGVQRLVRYRFAVRAPGWPLIKDRDEWAGIADERLRDIG